MIEKISSFFWKIAGWKTFLLGFILYMFFGGYVMPQGVKTFEELSGKKVKVLDLQFSYTPEKARAILNDYGDAGRAFAIKFGLIADTVYPMAYTFYFIIIFTWILKALSRYGIRYKYLHLFPLLIIIADYCENIALVNLHGNYPNFSDAAVYVASSLTTFKWVLVIVLAVMMIAGLIVLGAKKITKAPTVS